MHAPVPDSSTYSLDEFVKLIARHPRTLQRWDRLGLLVAYRTPTGRRFYIHAQYLAQAYQAAIAELRTIVYCRVSISLYRLCKYRKPLTEGLGSK